MKTLDSWKLNATSWINLLKEQTLASRKLTNTALINTITNHQPESVLDMGCGEGWLGRALSQKGIHTVGVDGTQALVDYANAHSALPHYPMSFEEVIAAKSLPESPFQAAVFNFCLYEKSLSAALLRKVHQFLDGEKYVFIQTLHPETLIEQGIENKDQWIENVWKGLPGDFHSPHAWQFLTLNSWEALIQESGWKSTRR